MIAYKHHVSEHFPDKVKLNAGVGKGATMFLDYEYMKQYLLEDGRQWHIVKVEVEESDFTYYNKALGMVTALRNIKTKYKWHPLKIKFTDALYYLMRKEEMEAMLGVEDNVLLEKAAKLSGCSPTGSISERLSKLCSYIFKDKRFTKFRYKSSMFYSGQPCTRVGYSIDLDLYNSSILIRVDADEYTHWIEDRESCIFLKTDTFYQVDDNVCITDGKRRVNKRLLVVHNNVLSPKYTTMLGFYP